MKRTVPRRRSVPKVRRNAEGKPRERFEGLRDESYREWVRSLPCVVNKADRCVYADHRSDAAHVESKARGAGDAGNLIPLCRRHHREQHDYGMKSFEREHQLSSRLVAGELWLVYERTQGAPQL